MCKNMVSEYPSPRMSCPGHKGIDRRGGADLKTWARRQAHAASRKWQIGAACRRAGNPLFVMSKRNSKGTSFKRGVDHERITSWVSPPTSYIANCSAQRVYSTKSIRKRGTRANATKIVAT